MYSLSVLFDCLLSSIVRHERAANRSREDPGYKKLVGFRENHVVYRPSKNKTFIDMTKLQT